MPYTQFETCTSVYGTTYIVPIVGDTAGLLAITERSYTYRLRNANPRLRPSQFSRPTVDKVFEFMIEGLRHIRNTGSKQVQKYGVENFPALLADTEKRVCSLQSRLKARADQLLQWKTCTSWKSSLIFELQFQFPFDYHDIIPRKRGSNWLFLYKNPTGHRTSYALPILRINDACIEGLEWTARFSKATPGLGGFVPPELIRAAFETYICRIVPKPGSIMGNIFSEQFNRQLGEQTASSPRESLPSKGKPWNQPALPEQSIATEEQPDNASEDEFEDPSNYGHADGSGWAGDHSRPDEEREGDNSVFEQEALDSESEASDQGYCSVGMEITCISGAIIKVPQHYKQSRKGVARVIVALRTSAQCKSVKRLRSPSPEAASDEVQSLVADESEARYEQIPRHKRLKMNGNSDTDSDNDRELFAKSSRQNNDIEDCNPEPGTDVEFGSERVSSPDSKVEDDAISESETSSEGESDQKLHLSNSSQKCSNSEHDVCSVEIPAYAHKPSPRSNHIEDYAPEPGTDSEHGSERVSSPERKLEDDSASESVISSESVTSSELEPDPNLPLPNLSKPSSHSGQDLCPVEITAHTHSSNSSSSSNSMAKNNNTIISKAKVLAHPGNSGVELQNNELMQPTIKTFQVPVLAPRKLISPGPRHTGRYSASSDMLTTLERYLDDLDALPIQVSVGTHM